MFQVVDFEVLFRVRKQKVPTMLIHRLKLIVPASVLVLSTAQTASGAELPTQLIECRALTSAVERLDCYDQVVDAHTATANHASPAQMEDNSPPVAPVVVTASPESAPDLSREELFGKDGRANTQVDPGGYRRRRT